MPYIAVVSPVPRTAAENESHDCDLSLVSLSQNGALVQLQDSAALLQSSSLVLQLGNEQLRP